MASRPLSLLSLPDDVLTHILRRVPQYQRLLAVALVSRRMRSLAVSPALIGELEVKFREDSSTCPVSALLLWLARHGRDVRELSFNISGPRPVYDWIDQGPDPCGNFLTACLTAACMAAPLRRVSVLGFSLPTLAWLPLVAGSLEELKMTGYESRIDVSLHELTKLTSLDLEAADWPPHVRLPPNLLHFYCRSYLLRMDHLQSQLGTLDRLASLSLWLHHHEGTIALSCPLRSLTSLQWVSKGLSLGWLAQQTGLRWLEMVAVVPEAGPDASSLAAALAPLCQLTSLKLVDLRCSTDGLPQALQQLRALRRLRLDNMPPATLLPGPWLAGLRRLTVDVLTLLGSLPALHAAVGLQRLHVLHFSAENYQRCTGAGDPLTEVADSQWQALCQWVERHPQLSRLDLVLEDGAAPLPPALLRGMLAVQRRRPGLAVYCGLGSWARFQPLKLHGNLDRNYRLDSGSAGLS